MKTKYKKGFFLEPKNSAQKAYINAINHSQLIIADGPAGTGKTYCAAMLAAKMYNDRIIDRIILSRPNIPASKSIGFFPGDLNEKMEPWVAPIFNVLEEVLQKGALETGIKHKRIEVVPFEVMRGRSFEDAFVLLDEAQNTTYHEMKMFLTRLGEGCTTIVDGDTNQTDIKTGETGLGAAKRLLKGIKGVSVIEFTPDDIVRSGLVREVLERFNSD